MFNSKLFFETVEKLVLDGIELKIKKNDKNLEAFIEKIEGEEQGYINFTTNDDKYIFKGKYTHKESDIFGDLYNFLQNEQSNLFNKVDTSSNNKVENNLFNTANEKISKIDKACEILQREELFLENIKTLKEVNFNIELEKLKIYKFNNQYFFNADFNIDKKNIGSIERFVDSFTGKPKTEYDIINSENYEQIKQIFPNIETVIESMVGIEVCKKELKNLLHNDILLKYKINGTLYVDLTDNFEKLSKKTLDDLKHKHSGKECFLWNNKEKKWFNLDKVKVEEQQINIKDR